MRCFQSYPKDHMYCPFGEQASEKEAAHSAIGGNMFQHGPEALHSSVLVLGHLSPVSSRPEGALRALGICNKPREDAVKQVLPLCSGAEGLMPTWSPARSQMGTQVPQAGRAVQGPHMCRTRSGFKEWPLGSEHVLCCHSRQRAPGDRKVFLCLRSW